MLNPEARRNVLESFLSRSGISIERLVDEIDDSLGNVQAVVATGSVLQGFGNDRSDLDLYAIVDSSVTQLPLMSFNADLKIDVCRHGADDVLAATAELKTPWPSTTIDRQSWQRRRRSLDTISRFRLGYPVQADSAWSPWLSDLQADWLADSLHSWWRVEAARRTIGARLLMPARPLAACQRYFDAVTALMQAEAVGLGELYFTIKWIGRKLRSCGAEELLSLYQELIIAPERVAVGKYAERCEEVLAPVMEEATTTNWQSSYQLARGTSLHPLGGTLLATRWQLRGVEVDELARNVPPTDPLPATQVLWSGSIGQPKPDHIQELAQHDLLWVGLEAGGDA